MNEAGETLEREGWSLRFAEGASALAPAMRAEIVERALMLAAGVAGAPLRRSRHASTYHLSVSVAPAASAFAGAGAPAGAMAAGGSAEVFVKLLDAPVGGLGAPRSLAMGSRAERLLGIAHALEARGFAIAPIVLMGEERSGRTMMVTEQVSGVPLPRYLSGAAGALERKRRALRALGAEVARMHRAGFLHGDLTPYNIFVASGGTPRFVFIDHERTVRPRLVWRRRRLRNLVQLCRFDRAGMSRTDRLRIVDAYALAMGDQRRRVARRVAAMLRARRRRDAAGARRRSAEVCSGAPRTGADGARRGQT